VKPFLLYPSSSVLMIIDLQERLLSAVETPERTVFINRRLLKAAQELAIPTMVTEQYPKGLGPTEASMELESFPEICLLEKIHFCCTQEDSCMEHIRGLERKQIVLSGIEAHICVLSTALDLLEKGFQVVIAADGVSSRTPGHRKQALHTAAQAGALVLPEESIVYQWLGKAGTEEFKKLLPLYASSKPS